VTTSQSRSRLTRLIRDHWNERASTFDEEPGHGVRGLEQHDAWVALLATVTGGAPMRVLDVGCGTGFLTLLLAEMGHSVTGIDLAERMLTAAKEKARRAGLSVEFRLENATSLRDSDATYDVVIARHVIWALPDPSLGVREWLRVLKPGGRLALIEGQWSSGDAAGEGLGTSQSTLAARVRAVLRILYYGVKERQLARVPAKLRTLRYHAAQKALPFSSGAPADRLVTLLEAHGVGNVAVTPLLNPALWAGPSQYPRYLAVGQRSSGV
jgi:2-polyprenyl-3-methyl-5-hydroxy-6-metoxy-1,4-benzoquinol methylase